MRWSSKKGFVLPEVMLATVIASFAICGMLLMYVTSMDLIRTSKNASIATSAAQGLIEEIRSVPFFCLKETSCCSAAYCTPQPKCSGYFCYNGLNFTVNGIPSSIGVVTIEVVKVDADMVPTLLEVTVSVSWRQAGRAVDSNVTLATQVASR